MCVWWEGDAVADMCGWCCSHSTIQVKTQDVQGNLNSLQLPRGNFGAAPLLLPDFHFPSHSMGCKPWAPVLHQWCGAPDPCQSPASPPLASTRWLNQDRSGSLWPEGDSRISLLLSPSFPIHSPGTFALICWFAFRTVMQACMQEGKNMTTGGYKEKVQFQ